MGGLAGGGHFPEAPASVQENRGRGPLRHHLNRRLCYCLELAEEFSVLAQGFQLARSWLVATAWVAQYV